jgi:hypothetical protein
MGRRVDVKRSTRQNLAHLTLSHVRARRSRVEIDENCSCRESQSLCSDWRNCVSWLVAAEAPWRSRAQQFAFPVDPTRACLAQGISFPPVEGAAAALLPDGQYSRDLFEIFLYCGTRQWLLIVLLSLVYAHDTRSAMTSSCGRSTLGMRQSLFAVVIFP